MANILAVGIATLDIINIVEAYPQEDAELRALAQQVRRGGNATNTLAVLSQLGHHCSWAGTLAEEPDALTIEADLAQYAIDTRYVHRAASGKVPTSYICLSQQTGSRTIVHHRDLDEYSFEQFIKIDLSGFDWVHIEGRNVEATRQMLTQLKSQRPDLSCSLEIEKERPGISTLIPHADLLLFSRAYALAQGYATAEAFLQGQHKSHGKAAMVCAWGDEGAYAIDRDKNLHSAPAFPPPKVVDTLGAGDVFNAGMIDALLRGKSLDEALMAASRLAGKKCGQHGFAELTAS